MNKQTIERILKEYKIEPEYQYVLGSIEEDTHTIYQSIPYQPETTIYFIWKLTHPKQSPKEIEEQSQKYLHKNPNIKTYLQEHLNRCLQNAK